MASKFHSAADKTVLVKQIVSALEMITDPVKIKCLPEISFAESHEGVAISAHYPNENATFGWFSDGSMSFERDWNGDFTNICVNAAGTASISFSGRNDDQVIPPNRSDHYCDRLRGILVNILPLARCWQKYHPR